MVTSPRLWRPRLVFWIGALATGIISTGFAFMADEAQHIFARAFVHDGWQRFLRLLVSPAGFMLCAWGMWDAHVVTPQWGFWEFAGVQAMRGVGVMIAMIASQQVTMSTLPPQMVKNASGLVNLARNVGGAFGLAYLNTTLNTQTAVHMGELTDRISQANGQMQDLLAGMQERFASSVDPAGAAMKAVWGLLQRQATTLAFGDAFAILAIACVFAGFVTLLSKPGKAAMGGAPSEVH